MTDLVRILGVVFIAALVAMLGTIWVVGIFGRMLLGDDIERWPGWVLIVSVWLGITAAFLVSQWTA